MIGRVDKAGRALVDLDVRATPNDPPTEISAWIDTGFTGELVLPGSIIEHLQLPETGTTAAVLADGSEVTLPTHECYVAWFDQLLRLQVVANNGKYPLLGVGLLLDRDLFVSYRSGQLRID
jgi:clan AA aspartic protease